MRPAGHMGVGDKQRIDTHHQSATRRPPPAASVAPSTSQHTTPKQQQTPRRLDWTAEKIAAKLRGFAKDLEAQHNIMIYRMIGENAKAVKERRLKEGEDLFANVKRPDMPEDKRLTARVKFKASTYACMARFYHEFPSRAPD